MTREEFIDHWFPKDVIRNLVKAGFFKDKKPSYDEIEKRVCERLGLKSIFDYEHMLDGVAYHLTFTKAGLKKEIERLNQDKQNEDSDPSR